MLAHIRACLWLLVLTVAVCCVLYPLALWAVGQGLFHAFDLNLLGTPTEPILWRRDTAPKHVDHKSHVQSR